MPQPWERYAQQQPQPQQAGPWQQYQPAAPATPSRGPIGPQFEDAHPPYLSRAAGAYADFFKAAVRNPRQLPQAVKETALTVGSGMVAAPVNDFWNSAMEALRFPTKDVVPTYQPKSELGQASVRAMGEVLSPVAEGIDYMTSVKDPDPGVRSTGLAIRGTLGVLPFVGARNIPKAQRTPERAPAPTTAELRTAADDAFKRARELGREEIVKHDSLGKFVNDAEGVLGAAEYAFDPRLHPQTAIAYDILMQEATKPGIAGHTPQGLEVIRRKLLTAESNAYKAGGGDDARLAGKLLDDFDQFADNLVDGRDIIGTGAGDAKASIAARAEARELWSRLKRAQTIETLVERAMNRAPGQTARGFENTLRNEFVNLANNPRRMRQFSAEEKAAIQQVARGGVVQRVSRAASGLALRGPVSATAGAVLGGGPAGAGAIFALGEAGALAARIMRLRDVEAASELVRRGRNAAPEATQPVISPVGAVRGSIIGSQVIPPANALYREQDRQRNALAR